MKIGITGQSGFIGTHLYNYLALKDKAERIRFEDAYFSDDKKLQNWVMQCDIIVHLAAVNRHNNPEVIYDTNIKLVKKLISACEATHSRPHIFFSSSTQEELGNPYGNSKKDGRKLFEEWAKSNKAQYTSFIIPNVFGPFGKPYYNSFIATFCYQLTHKEEPKVVKDSKVKLIYIGELVEEFWKRINMQRDSNDTTKYEMIHLKHTKEAAVSRVLSFLTSYKFDYFYNGIIPDLSNTFEKNLFNTFLCYIDYEKFFPFHLPIKTDDRGSFVETVKLKSGGQISFSTTGPDIIRGNHFHARKVERFAVMKGKAIIKFRRIDTDRIYSFELNGNKPSFVDMPIWHTHSITNIGEEDLYTLFWINELYDPKDSDTYFEVV